MLSALSRRVLSPCNRQLFKNIVRNDSHSHGGVPGENLPFDIHNKYKVTLYFTLFFGSGLGAPYLIVRHQLLKNAD